MVPVRVRDPDRAERVERLKAEHAAAQQQLTVEFSRAQALVQEQLAASDEALRELQARTTPCFTLTHS